MSDLAEFLLARIADDETVARAVIADDQGADEGYANQYELLTERFRPRFADAAARLITRFAVPARVLAECEAKRRIVELHQSWPVLVETPPEMTTGDSATDMTFRLTQRIAWLTQEEYRKRFGSEPPTAPMLRALALPYADHPDYREEWRP